MGRRTLAALVAAAFLGTGVTAWAQSQGGAGNQAPGGPAADAPAQQHPGMERMHRGQAATLFTPQEREQFREKMRNAKTPDERVKLRQEYRQLAEQRAKEKGITLSQPGEGGRGDRRMGPHGGRPATALLSPEERTQMHDKMRSAQTPEQRAELRKEYRALLEQRAKEKGIDLQQHRGPRGRQHDRHGPRAHA